MSNLVCPVCGSSNIQTERRPDGFHHCMECRYSWAIGASQQKQTVFDKITESVEKLAKEIVYPYKIRFAYGSEDNWQEYWTSPLIENFYPTQNEAIAATVEELKREWKK